jgi:xanthine dehydrogenase YagS FAD-binding subunit
MATVGGNLLQRTRCSYFRDTILPCNKRAPHSGCGALAGQNRLHAILGSSEQCIAIHPSDLGVALAALDAIIHTRGPTGERQIPINEFFLLPGDTPHRETSLESGELITAVEIPDLPMARHSLFLKVRDRASYAFALVSVAVALELYGGMIRDVRIALGGVAHKPWRCFKAETGLKGELATQATFSRAADTALRQAIPRTHNGFKVEMARRLIVRALTELSERI